MIPARDYGSSRLIRDGIADSWAPLRELHPEDGNRDLGPGLRPAQREWAASRDAAGQGTVAKLDGALLHLGEW
jgi:hypothetical protein